MFLRLGIQEVAELDLDESEGSIRRDCVLVQDVHADDGRVALRDEELGRTLPDRVGRALEGGRAVNDGVVQRDVEVGVDLLASGVELLGSVNGEADDSRLCAMMSSVRRMREREA